MKSGETKIVHTPGYIRDISERVYRSKLDSECGPGTAARVDDDHASGFKVKGKVVSSIRDRAKAYDKITRVYLDVLGIMPRGGRST